MNGFTSGTQAIQGRRVAHNSLPYVNPDDDDADFCYVCNAVTRWDADEHCNGCGRRWGYDEGAPRPEFDVLDNPILAAFRADWDRESMSRYPDPFEIVVTSWLRYIDRAATVNQSPEQREHARRVLAKLAAVYA